MKKILLVIVTLSIVFGSCKKEKEFDCDQCKEWYRNNESELFKEHCWNLILLNEKGGFVFEQSGYPAFSCNNFYKDYKPLSCDEQYKGYTLLCFYGDSIYNGSMLLTKPVYDKMKALKMSTHPPALNLFSTDTLYTNWWNYDVNFGINYWAQ